MDKRVLNSMNKFYKYMDDVEGYKILSDFKGMSKYITLKHENCGNIYKTTPSHFMNREQRCAKCNGLPQRGFINIKRNMKIIFQSKTIILCWKNIKEITKK